MNRVHHKIWKQINVDAWLRSHAIFRMTYACTHANKTLVMGVRDLDDYSFETVGYEPRSNTKYDDVQEQANQMVREMNAMGYQCTILPENFHWWQKEIKEKK